MSKLVQIVKDLSCFNERTDEIGSEISYEYVLEAISKIKHYLNSNRDCPALCAPQIGYKLRLFVVKKNKEDSLGGGKFDIFLNPIIVSKKDFHLSRERNESIIDKEFVIPRYNEVHVAYQEKDGKVNSKSFIGAYGEVVQQMVDMLDGLTLSDYGLEVGEDFDKASKEDKAKIIQLYLDYLKTISKNLQDEIEKTPELKTVDDTIKFMTGVLDGSITIVKEEEKK